MASEIPHGRTLDMDFMFTKLLVADLEKSATFYASVFGLVQMHRVEAEIDGRPVSEIVFMSTYSGGPMLILAKFHDRSQAAHDELILGFATKDLSDCLKRVELAGGSVVEPIKELPEAGMRNAFVKDPEGHLVQLSQIIA